MKIEEIVDGVISADKKSIARAITYVERGQAKKLLKLLKKKGKEIESHIIGFTGSGGSGKSTLINCVIKEFRKEGNKVGVIAIDPSSQFTGGAILGDRIRMMDHIFDDGVYIRSMSSGTSIGGLTNSVFDAIKILNYAGYEKILIETVGAGQDEVEIAKIADTTIVVFTPGYGDEIQLMKSGIMEIADIYVVNKGDIPGANELKSQIEAILDTMEMEKKPLVYLTTAIKNHGIKELVCGIKEHFEYLANNSFLKEKKKKRTETQLRYLLNQEFKKMIEEKIDIEEYVEKYKNKDVYTIANKILKKILK